MEIKPGQIYKHYKGDTYKIITLTKHTETEDDLVVYERLTDMNHTGWRIWARPLNMFLENIEYNGQSVPRFEYISE